MTKKKQSEANREPDRCQVRELHPDRVEAARREAAPEPRLARLAATFKALGDPTRLKLVMALGAGDMCVCDLAAFLGCTESGVSHHLRRLKDLALVKPRRDGQMLFYTLDDEHVSEVLQVGLAHVNE